MAVKVLSLVSSTVRVGVRTLSSHITKWKPGLAVALTITLYRSFPGSVISIENAPVPSAVVGNALLLLLCSAA